MTNYWTPRRWIALAVHAALALLLLVWSTSSSLHFWEFAFADSIYSYGAVVCIDGLALLGFTLHLARIDSPLASDRHALPLVSALPLAFDMHGQFLHLEGALTWVFTIGMTALLVALSFIVWRTIERLFITPVQAAREYAQQRMQSLVTVGEQMQVMQQVADGFVQQHQQRALGAVQPVQLAMQPVQTYARPDADVQPVYAPMQPAARVTDKLPDLPAPQEGVISVDPNDYGSVLSAVSQLHNPFFTHDEHEYRCIKCERVNTAPEGKSATALRKASGRYGCPKCKSA